MTRALASLPSWKEEPEVKAEIIVVDQKNGSEKNICTSEAAARASALKWIVKDYNGGSPLEYNGNETALPEGANNAAYCIYSNPTTKELCVHNATPNTSIRIYSIEGVLMVASGVDANGAICLPLNQLSGVYLVSIGREIHKLLIP